MIMPEKDVKRTPPPGRGRRVAPPGMASAASPGKGAPASESAGPLGTIETWIGRHPYAVIGLGLVVGVTLGWLVKRR